MAIDLDTKPIVAMRHRPGPCGDAPEMILLLEKVSRIVNVGTVAADKGYHSKAIRIFIWNDLKAEPQIHLWKRDRRKPTATKLTRLRQLKIFDEEKYHRWALVETVHSVLKRSMRGDDLARDPSSQRIDLGLRVGAYNSNRFEN
ncbi:MAG TPA: transposase [Methanomassiliicoccales archaeon]|nr:transposase [Methanomassiliicoccales archaeon]